MRKNISGNLAMLSELSFKEVSTNDIWVKKKQATPDKLKLIEVLNVLIAINNDRIVAYQAGLREAQEADLNPMFIKFIEISKKCRQQLSEKVLGLGGKPIESTTTAGNYYRVWMNVNAEHASHCRHALLNWSMAEENIVLAAYYNVVNLNLQHMPLALRAMINAQYDLIKADHARVKNICDLSIGRSWFPQLFLLR